jgi:hypothetical protein
MVEEEQSSDYAEVDFPIMLTPTAAKSSVEPTQERALPTWADNGIAWDAGL